MFQGKYNFGGFSQAPCSKYVVPGNETMSTHIGACVDSSFFPVYSLSV